MLAKEVAKEALLKATKDLLDHPEKLSMEIANQLMDEGMREYRENYRLYGNWKSGERLTEGVGGASRISTITRGGSRYASWASD